MNQKEVAKAQQDQYKKSTARSNNKSINKSIKNSDIDHVMELNRSQVSLLSVSSTSKSNNQMRSARQFESGIDGDGAEPYV